MPRKSVKDYKQDARNHNAGSVYGDTLLKGSIETNKLGRSILVSADGVTIAGNKTLAKAAEMGFDKVQEVETDGTTLVVVKRTDIKSGTKEFYQLAMADNYVQKHNFVEDADVVAAICEEYQIEPESIGALQGNEEEEQDNPPEGFGAAEQSVTVYYQSEADRQTLMKFIKQYGYHYELNS